MLQAIQEHTLFFSSLKESASVLIEFVYAHIELAVCVHNRAHVLGPTVLHRLVSYKHCILRFTGQTFHWTILVWGLQRSKCVSKSCDSCYVPPSVPPPSLATIILPLSFSLPHTLAHPLSCLILRSCPKNIRN